MGQSQGVQFIAAAILFVIAYIYAIHVAVTLSKYESGIGKTITEVHESSLVVVDSDVGRVLTSGRGRNYYIGATTDEKRDQLATSVMTFWGFAHFMFYLVLGFICPDLFWPTFAVGVGFELYEKVKYECHDVLDIAWNTLGFAAGRSLRHYADPASRAAPSSRTAQRQRKEFARLGSEI